MGDWYSTDLHRRHISGEHILIHPDCEDCTNGWDLDALDATFTAMGNVLAESTSQPPNRKDMPTMEKNMAEVQGYRVQIMLNTAEAEDDDEFFSNLPSAEEIAKALAPLFPPFCKVMVRDDGFSDVDIEGGKA